MIPQEFDYSRPQTLDEVLSLLAEGAKPLAGGMSLIPMMKLRLAVPEHLVDLGKIAGLNYIREEGGAIHIGATTTHHEVEAHTNRALIERARRTVVVSDSSKLGRAAFARICPIDRAHELITDDGAAPDAVEALRAAGLRVTTV